MKYTLIDNIKYLYKRAFKMYPSLKITLPLMIISAVLLPILSIAIASLAVELITKGSAFKDFLIIIGGIGVLWVSLSTTHKYLFSKIEFQQTMIRMTDFYGKMADKMMEKDYINIEPYDKQLLMEKAKVGYQSNWSGVEFFYKCFPLVIENSMILGLYTILISNLDFIVFAVLIMMTLSNVLLSKRAREYEQRNKNEYTKYDKRIQYLYEEGISVNNGKDVRMYKMEQWFRKSFNKLIKQRVAWHKRINLRYFIPECSDQILILIRDLITYGKLFELVLTNQISLSEFTIYIGVVTSFSSVLTELVNSYTDVRRANLGVVDFRIYEDIKNQYNHEHGIDISLLKEPIEIELKNVSFRYPNTKIDIIKNVNLKIRAGEKVALVGINGAGKTTLVKLICGLYYPTQGEILINGYPIDSFSIEEYYQLIGAVFQDIQILALTIEENVTATIDHQTDKEKLWRALELADLKSKILSLPKKEKTYITQVFDETGVQLSGGEMQRLMLARALYKDAPLLILDEPTSALDPIAEANLYQKYYNLTKDKTSIFISHRLSSTKFCERVLFFEYGEVIEDGTHQELLELDGKYAKMYQIQSHYYKEGKLE